MELAQFGLTGDNIVVEAINTKHLSSFRSQLEAGGGPLTPVSLSQRQRSKAAQIIQDRRSEAVGGRTGRRRFVHLFWSDEREAAPHSLPL